MNLWQRVRLFINQNKFYYLVFLLLFVFGFLIRFQNLFNMGSYYYLVVTEYEWDKNSYEIGFFNFWRDYKEYLDYLPGSIYYILCNFSQI